MKIVDGQPSHAEALVQIRATVRAATYVNERLGVTREYLLAHNTVSAESIAEEIQEIEKPDNHYWVAQEGTQLVGYVKACKKPKQLIDMIHVLPAYQGQGAGTKLLSEALAWLDAGQPIYLEVVEGNDRAQAWYERLGWRLSGTLLDGMPLPHGGFVREYEMVLDPRH